MNDQNDNKPYWSVIARTRRHSYFLPRNNLPGILLFALIALLGCLALAVSVAHMVAIGSIPHPDIVLLLIGSGLLSLGIYQGWKLWQMDRQQTQS